MWLADRAIYEDAFMLAAPPDPAWVAASMLLVKNNSGIEFQPVRFWSVADAAGAQVGFAIDYGWDFAEDSAREIDCALVAYDGKNPRLALYAFASLMHRLFSECGATALWARVPLRGGGAGLSRFFAAIGTTVTKVGRVVQPTTKAELRRAYYTATPASFYASPLGMRAKALELPRDGR